MHCGGIDAILAEDRGEEYAEFIRGAERMRRLAKLHSQAAIKNPAVHLRITDIETEKHGARDQIPSRTLSIKRTPSIRTAPSRTPS